MIDVNVGSLYFMSVLLTYLYDYPLGSISPQPKGILATKLMRTRVPPSFFLLADGVQFFIVLDMLPTWNGIRVR